MSIINPSVSTTKDTKYYWYAAGAIIGIVTLGFAYSKYKEGKKNGGVLKAADDKKELERITSSTTTSSAKSNSDIGMPLNKSAFDEADNKPAAEELSPEHEKANSIRDNAFQLGAEDVAQPMDIIKEQKKEAAPKPSNKVPPNAYVGAAGNGDGAFQEGDVVWAYRDQNVAKAQLANGQLIDTKKDGSGFGSVPFKHRQKLGVIQVLNPDGAYIKLAPDFRGYGYVSYRNMFKLV